MIAPVPRGVDRARQDDACRDPDGGRPSRSCSPRSPGSSTSTSPSPHWLSSSSARPCSARPCALASLGMLVASRIRKQLENFAVVDELRDLPDVLPQRRPLPDRKAGELAAAAGPDQPAHLRRRPDAPLRCSRDEFRAVLEPHRVRNRSVGHRLPGRRSRSSRPGDRDPIFFGREDHLSAMFLSRLPKRVPFLTRLSVSRPAKLRFPERRTASTPAGVSSAFCRSPGGPAAGWAGCRDAGRAEPASSSREFKRGDHASAGASPARSPGRCCG